MLKNKITWEISNCLVAAVIFTMVLFGAKLYAQSVESEITSQVIKIEKASVLAEKVKSLAELKALLKTWETQNQEMSTALEKELAVIKSQILRAKGDEKKLLNEKFKQKQENLDQVKTKELQTSTWLYTFDPHFEVALDKNKPDCKFLLHALTLAYNLKDNQTEPTSFNGQMAFRVGRAICPDDKR